MRLLALAAVTATTGCILSTPLTATTETLLSPAQSTMVVPHGLVESQQLVIDKLGMRGFPLVERRVTETGAELRFLGNRDFRGYHTLGSVFRATVTPVSAQATRVTLVGKPTIDHHEATCVPPPAGETRDLSKPPCEPITIEGNDWGITGTDEVNVIRGVLAELQLDATQSALGS